uniref:PDZ domain-containing protein n=1 Tax=Anopheles albimanus TaxID=7167 RepID=A0A182FKX5_ANOAL
MHAAAGNGGGGGGGSTVAGGSGATGGGGAHRRRKKRSNYGIRSVEVNRGTNGFGFTISGQQPCILSCIVAGSPADLAGLRAGDFLISVNGMNVSKLPHESVVQLIGGTHGTIRMAIAENYYSDSSDEDIMFHGAQQQQQHRARPKYPHKAKFSRAAAGNGAMATNGSAANNGQQTSTDRSTAVVCGATPIKALSSPPPPLAHHQHHHHHSQQQQLHGESGDDCLNETTTSATAYNVIHSPNASSSCDISNVSAMVRSVQLGDESPLLAVQGGARGAGTAVGAGQTEESLEYQAVVGYLGTIEMPKQIATSSKLQTVRSCIRKMRQEKRNPTTVLMTILPSCLNLTNTSNNLIAKYASARLSYVSSSSESDNKYFGLVTSAIYADGLMCESSDVLSHRKDVVISNSCHVFVIDAKLVEHELHLEKAALFGIVCTKDPITNLCLEFPSNSEYVVNLIRSMYSLKSLMKADGAGVGGRPPVARSLNLDGSNANGPSVAGGGGGGGGGRYPRNRSADPRLNARVADDPHDALAASSPQPSNHSEITTTSSNSDSGIGFHNDCRNISDRILLVDFPGMLGPQQQRLLQQQQIANVRAHYRKSHPFLRPAGIINEIPPKLDPIRNIRSTTGSGLAGPSGVQIQDHLGASSSSGGSRLQIVHGKSKSADYSFPSTSSASFVDRLTVRARPDPKAFGSDRSPSKENALNCLHAHDAPVGSDEEEASGPDPWTEGHTLDEQGNVVQERAIDVRPMADLFRDLERYNTDNVKNSLLASARSCDDMILSLGKEASSGSPPVDGGGEGLADFMLDAEAYERLKIKLSIDDLTLVTRASERFPADDREVGTANVHEGTASGGSVTTNGAASTQTQPSHQHVFLQPLKPVKRSKKACTTHTSKASAGRMAALHGHSTTDENSSSNRSSAHGGVVARVGDKLAAYKLSPKVFGLPRPFSVSFENISTLSQDGKGAGTHRMDEVGGNGGVAVGAGEGGAGAERNAGNRKGGSHKSGHGTPGRASRSAKRLSGGFSAIWGSLQELRTGGFTSKGDDRARQHDESQAGGSNGSVPKQKDRERRLSGMKILEATYSEPDLRFDEVSDFRPNI